MSEPFEMQELELSAHLRVLVLHSGMVMIYNPHTQEDITLNPAELQNLFNLCLIKQLVRTPMF